MSSTTQRKEPEAKDSKCGFFYGYALVAILGFLYFCSSGIILATATIVNPLMLQDEALGMNATMLGTGFSLFVLVQGISAPLVGALISKFGARFSMTLGAVVLLCAILALIFFVSSPVAYFAVFGVVASAATMMVGQLAVQSTLGSWFCGASWRSDDLHDGHWRKFVIYCTACRERHYGSHRRRLEKRLVSHAALVALAIPVAFFLVKNHPSDIGEMPDGTSGAKVAAKKCDYRFVVYKNKESVPFKQVVRTPTFWLISLAATSGFAAYTLSTSQGVLHFTSLGFDSGLIVAGVALMGAMGLVGKISMGIVSDRIEPIRLIVVAALILVIGIVVGAEASSDAMLLVFYACIGVGFGGVNAVFPTAMANYFGAGSLSKNLGTVIMITTLVASALPIMSGAFFDATGSCALAFYVTAGIVAACAVCGILVRFPARGEGGVRSKEVVGG